VEKAKIKKQIMSFEILLLLLINFFGLSYQLFQKDAHFEKKNQFIKKLYEK
jgi:hypothetical protein